MDSDKMKEVFDIYDTNETGFISMEDFPKALRAAGFFPSENTIQLLKEEASNNRTMKFAEFRRLGERCKELAPIDKEGIRNALKLLDKQGDGRVSAAELKSLMTNEGECLQESEFDNVLNEFEVDEDGRVAIDALLDGLFNRSVI